MDPEISLMFQCTSPLSNSKCQVRAELSPLYDRHPLPGDRVQIETAWAARRQREPWLFDAVKFRLHSIKQEGGVLVFRLGITSYKDFVGTNLGNRVEQLRHQGHEDFGNSQVYLADPLGVGAMLHTADDKFVFLRRSLCVGEAQGKVDIPGGHPEPQVVTGETVSEGPICHQDLAGELVVKELFSSVLREIQDEVNLPPSTLSFPELLGIARNETSGGRASAEFYVRCSLTSEEVQHKYAIGGPEAQESTNIIFVTRENRKAKTKLPIEPHQQRILLTWSKGKEAPVPLLKGHFQLGNQRADNGAERGPVERAVPFSKGGHKTLHRSDGPMPVT